MNSAQVTVPADILAAAYDAAIDMWNDGISLNAAIVITATDFARRGYDRAQMLAYLTNEASAMRKLTRLNTED